MSETKHDQVWTLVIDSGSGTRVRVFWTEERAKDYLAAYVRDRWAAVGDHDRYTQAEFDAVSDGDAISEYFGGPAPDEWFILEPATVEG